MYKYYLEIIKLDEIDKGTCLVFLTLLDQFFFSVYISIQDCIFSSAAYTYKNIASAPVARRSKFAALDIFFYLNKLASSDVHLNQK